MLTFKFLITVLTSDRKIGGEDDTWANAAAEAWGWGWWWSEGWELGCNDGWAVGWWWWKAAVLLRWCCCWCCSLRSSISTPSDLCNTKPFVFRHLPQGSYRQTNRSITKRYIPDT